ncbi:hypothetical protein SN15_08915 [Stenotrophomonas maltophilia]|nr:hypothetical protein SN15_08915 [Stenotrophomonas maltophilia]
MLRLGSLCPSMGTDMELSRCAWWYPWLLQADSWLASASRAQQVMRRFINLLQIKVSRDHKEKQGASGVTTVKQRTVGSARFKDCLAFDAA